MTDRVGLVTGGSQGIGLEIALGLAREGAHVGICARRLPQLEDAAKAIAANGVDVEALALDVTDPSSAATARNLVLGRFGRLGILVNSAGKGTPKHLLDQTDTDWQSAFELNLLSAVRFSLACAPAMRAAGGGRILNVSSRVAREPDPYFAAMQPRRPAGSTSPRAWPMLSPNTASFPTASFPV